MRFKLSHFFFSHHLTVTFHNKIPKFFIFKWWWWGGGLKPSWIYTCEKKCPSNIFCLSLTLGGPVIYNSECKCQSAFYHSEVLWLYYIKKQKCVDKKSNLIEGCHNFIYYMYMYAWNKGKYWNFKDIILAVYFII